MNTPGYITFKVYFQVYGGQHKPLEYQLFIKNTTVHSLAKQLNLAFIPEINQQGNVCMAENLEVRPEFRQIISNVHLRNFLYAILNSTKYEAIRKTLLQFDFSPFLFTGNTEDFWKLVSYGETLIRMHARGISGSFNSEAGYSEGGSCIIEPSEICFENESQKIWINKKQYFFNVPPELWTYKTGGIQPLLHWLIDRSGQRLNNADITEFIQLTAMIKETFRISRAIGTVIKHPPSLKKY